MSNDAKVSQSTKTMKKRLPKRTRTRTLHSRAGALVLLAFVAAALPTLVFETVASADVSSVSVSADSYVSGNTSAHWMIAFTTPHSLSGTAIPADTVSVTFPSGFDVSGVGVFSIGAAFGCGVPPSASVALQVVTITLNPLCTGLTSPPVFTSVTLYGINAMASSYLASGFTVATSQDPTPVGAGGSPIVITAPTAVSGVTFSGSSTVAGATNTTWTAGFTTSASGGLSSTSSDVIDVIFPSGFGFATSSPVITFSSNFTGDCATSSTPGSESGGDVTISLHGSCALGASTLGSLTIAGVTNPSANSYTGTIVTSTDTASTTSSTFTISAAATETVTFVADGGATVAPVSGPYNTAVSLPSDTQTGYAFNGWFTAATGGTQVTSPDTLTANATLYAQWTANTETVTFVADNGAAVAPVSGPYNTAVSLPSDTQTGYAFNGWFTAATGGTQVTSPDTLTANATLYAQWTANTETVTFVADGGAAVAPVSGPYNTAVSLPSDTQTGYAFNGWFTAATGGTQVTSPDTLTANATLYAQWTANTETVTFVADNGAAVAPVSGPYNTAVSLPSDTQTGYAFNGWFTAATGGTQVTSPDTLTANATLYAQWTLNLTITFPPFCLPGSVLSNGTCVPVPVITNIYPPSGLPGVATPIDILGFNFGTSAALVVVTYGPTGIEFACDPGTFVSTTSLVCTVGTNVAPGVSVSFVVTVNGVSSAPSAKTYTGVLVCAPGSVPTNGACVPIPLITSVSPTSGPANEIQNILISGSNFGTSATAQVVVTYGPTGMEFACDPETFVSMTMLQCTTGTNVASGVSVSFVVTVNGVSSAPSAMTYTGVLVCAAGSYLSSFNTCTAASPGFFVSMAGATSALACPVGTYSAASGQTSCTPAAPDSFVATAGATSASSCAVGTTTLGQSGSTVCVSTKVITSVSSGGLCVGDGTLSLTDCPATGIPLLYVYGNNFAATDQITGITGPTVMGADGSLQTTIGPQVGSNTLTISVSGLPVGSRNSVTLTFRANAETIYFASNDGEGILDMQTVTYGVATTLDPSYFARRGFTFTGWNTVADGSGTPYKDGASITATSSVNLYAQWKFNAPANLTAQQGGNNETAILSWDAEPANGSTVTYTVLAADGSVLGTTTGTQLVVQFTSSQVGNSVVFTVTAGHVTGTSLASAPVTVLFIDTTALSGAPEKAYSPATTTLVKVPSASGSSATLQAKATGGGSVVTQAYSAAPVSSASFALGNSGATATVSNFFDVKVQSAPNGQLPKTVVFTLCSADFRPSQRVLWYNPLTKSYQPVTDFKVFDPDTGCWAVTIKNPSTLRPTMKEMSGTIFALVRISPKVLGQLFANASGSVFTTRGITNLGSVSPTTLNAVNGVVGVAAKPDGKGYWVLTSFGNVHAFGTAKVYGQLNHSASLTVAIVPTKDGKGYYLVSHNGDIFHFGDAHFYGSLVSRSIEPHSSVVSMGLSPDGKGYWLVDNFGQVYAFGDAHFYGSFYQPKPLVLAYPVAGITPTVDGKGYWLVDSVGQVYAFGDAKYYGSLKLQSSQAKVVAIAASPTGKGYWLIRSTGVVSGFGDAKSYSAPKGLTGLIVSGVLVS